MAIPAFSAAHIICDVSKWTLTHLRIQKLLYLSHLHYLGEVGEPLIEEEFEAWECGPIVPALYNKIRTFYDRPVRNVWGALTQDESKEVQFLTRKAPELLNLTLWDLVLANHLKGGAWERHYNQPGELIKIPNKDILVEYNLFYRDLTQENQNDSLKKRDISAL